MRNAIRRMTSMEYMHSDNRVLLCILQEASELRRYTAIAAAAAAAAVTAKTPTAIAERTHSNFSCVRDFRISQIIQLPTAWPNDDSRSLIIQ